MSSVLPLHINSQFSFMGEARVPESKVMSCAKPSLVGKRLKPESRTHDRDLQELNSKLLNFSSRFNKQMSSGIPDDICKPTAQRRQPSVSPSPLSSDIYSRLFNRLINESFVIKETPRQKLEKLKEQL